MQNIGVKVLITNRKIWGGVDNLCNKKAETNMVGW